MQAVSSQVSSHEQQGTKSWCWQGQREQLKTLICYEWKEKQALMRKYITFGIFFQCCLPFLWAFPGSLILVWCWCCPLPGAGRGLSTAFIDSICSRDTGVEQFSAHWAGSCSQSAAITHLNSQRALNSHQSKQGWITSSATAERWFWAKPKQTNNPPTLTAKPFGQKMCSSSTREHLKFCSNTPENAEISLQPELPSLSRFEAKKRWCFYGSITPGQEQSRC